MKNYRYLLAAIVFMLCCSGCSSSSTEPVNQTSTQVETEAVTQAVTQAETEAVTQAVTQAETEAVRQVSELFQYYVDNLYADVGVEIVDSSGNVITDEFKSRYNDWKQNGRYDLIQDEYMQLNCSFKVDHANLIPLEKDPTALSDEYGYYGVTDYFKEMVGKVFSGDENVTVTDSNGADASQAFIKECGTYYEKEQWDALYAKFLQNKYNFSVKN